MRAERPILFSTDMVQALLAGRKTQTRRIVKPQPEEGKMIGDCPWVDSNVAIQRDTGACLCREVKCPYGQLGDLLWVREKWSVVERHGLGEGRFVVFEDEWEKGQVNERAPFRYTVFPYKYGGHPSIHMRKEWCRIWLEITEIRVERVQAISDTDVFAEGVQLGGFPYDLPPSAWSGLWIKINDPESWDANPWVWVIEFKVLSTTGRPQPPQ